MSYAIRGDARNCSNTSTVTSKPNYKVSYAIRGDTCNDFTTTAITSNAKYIAPDSDIYLTGVTGMMLYPGRTGFTYPYKNPKNLKSWKVKSSQEKQVLFESKKGKTVIDPSSSITEKCASC